jgi:hypothetical protein
MHNGTPQIKKDFIELPSLFWTFCLCVKNFRTSISKILIFFTLLHNYASIQSVSTHWLKLMKIWFKATDLRIINNLGANRYISYPLHKNS